MPFRQLEVVARYTRSRRTVIPPPIIADANTAFDVITKIRNGNTLLWLEEMLMLSLGTNRQLLSWTKIATGGTNFVIPDIRVINSKAAISLGSHFILAHNHPSGLLIPSAADINITHRVARSFREMGIELADHIIFSDTGYFSLKDHRYF